MSVAAQSLAVPIRLSVAAPAYNEAAGIEAAEKKVDEEFQ